MNVKQLTTSLETKSFIKICIDYGQFIGALNVVLQLISYDFPGNRQ